MLALNDFAQGSARDTSADGSVIVGDTFTVSSGGGNPEMKHGLAA